MRHLSIVALTFFALAAAFNFWGLLGIGLALVFGAAALWAIQGIGTDSLSKPAQLRGRSYRR
jgi:hypothetical protein